VTTDNPRPTPNTRGTAGGSLNELTGRASQGQIDAGRTGELKTAAVLDKVCRGNGPTVLHDLDIPLDKVSANIDHIVVSGNSVLIIDSKYWRPGRYWTFGGKTRCGLARVAHADKKTMKMAHQAIESHLLKYRAVVRIPLVVVWPSSKNVKFSLRWYRPLGATAISGEDFQARVSKIVGAAPADPVIVGVLTGLLKNQARSR
jgi:hypothetical protein